MDPRRQRTGRPARSVLVAALLVLGAGCSSSGGASDADRSTTSAPSTSAAPTTTSTSRPSTTTLAGVDAGVFAGDWYGHTRALTIEADGRATEHVGDGCCNPLIDLTFTLTAVDGASHQQGTASATVTSVEVHPGWSEDIDREPPKVGQTAAITLQDGVMIEPLSGATYCDEAAAETGICGA